VLRDRFGKGVIEMVVEVDEGIETKQFWLVSTVAGNLRPQLGTLIWLTADNHPFLPDHHLVLNLILEPRAEPYLLSTELLAGDHPSTPRTPSILVQTLELQIHAGGECRQVVVRSISESWS
jgi:hypothetical protein